MPEISINLNAPRVVRPVVAEKKPLLPILADRLFAAKSKVVGAISQLHWADVKGAVLAGAPSVAYPFTQPVKYTWQKGCSFFSPAQDPSPVVQRIHKGAEKRLEEAAKLGLTINPIPIAVEVKNGNGTNLHKAIDAKATDIGKKLSAFATFIQMRDWSGASPIGDAETDNLALLGLAKEAVENPTVSAWKLFVKRYNPSIWQKVKAAVFSFFCSNILAKTIDTYLKGFIEQVKTKFVTENDQTRNAIFFELLGNLDEFCSKDEAATRRFADGKEKETLPQLRIGSIEEKYQKDLPKLCAFLSESFTAACSVQVPLFSKILTEAPLIGHIFKLLESFINRFIIHKVVKSVLPDILETAASTGISLSDPTNVPFGLAISIFIREQLQNFNKELADDLLKDTPPATGVKLISGMEQQLPNMIKKLKRILAMERYQDILELQTKIEELKKNSQEKSADTAADEAIESGIIDGVNRLFQHLNETAKSGELFTTLLDLCDTLFSDDNQDLKALQKQHEEEKEKIDREAASVVTKLLYSKLPQIIDTKIEGWIPEGLRGTSRDVRIATNKLFEEKRIKIRETLRAAQELCVKIENQVGQSDSLAQGQGIQRHLVSLLEAVRNLSYRAKPDSDVKKLEIEDKIEKLSSLDQEALWKALTPIYERIEKLTSEQTTDLQLLQQEYTSYTEIEKHLRQIHTIWNLLQSNQTLPNEWMQTLTQSFEKILLLFSFEGKADFEAKRADLNALYAQWKNADKAFKTIHDFESQLQMLYAYEKNKHSWGFKLKDCMAKIDLLLTLPAFSADERKQLKALIGKGYPIQSNKTQLTSLIESIQSRHKAASTLCQTESLRHLSEQNGSWAEQNAQNCATRKQAAQQEMQQISKTLAQQINLQLREVTELDSPLSKAITPLAEDVIAGVASIGTYSAIAYPAAAVLGAPWAPLYLPVAALLGTGASLVSRLVWKGERAKTLPAEEPVNLADKTLTRKEIEEKEENELSEKKQEAKKAIRSHVLAPSLSALLLSPLHPALPFVAANALSFWSGDQIKQRAYSYAQNLWIAPKIKRIFDGVKDLCLEQDQRVYKWFYTSSMLSLAKGFEWIAKEKQRKQETNPLTS